MRIKSDCVERILDKADIVSVVGEHVSLKRAGANYKGLCPFHDERTPSFTVSPRRNICKCFSCDTPAMSPVGFLMKHLNIDYREALERLAKQFNITLEYEDAVANPEAERAAERRDIARNVIAAAQDYFTASLQADTAEAAAARAYAYGRWGEDFCKDFGIGFAPSNWTGLTAYLRSKGFSEDAMLYSGLVSKKDPATNPRNRSPYDFFYGRITIPYRSRASLIDSYMARAMSDDAKPKYLNTSDTVVFRKERSLFGIDVAMRNIRESNRIYIVEGAPDVMRLMIIGVNTAVAPCGTAFGQYQMDMLKKITDTLVFIPDSDHLSTAGNAAFGPGFMAVIKNGKAALAAGFNVSVKQIPLAEPPEKRDADSYITSKEIFDSLAEVPFPIWYGEILLAKCSSQDDYAKAVEEISEVVAMLRNETSRDLTIEHLSNIFGKKSTWKKAVKNKERKVKSEREVEAGSRLTKDAALLHQYGIVIKNGCYGSYKNEEFQKWSNFVMEPLFHIARDRGASRVFRLKNCDGFVREVEFQPEELISLAKFMARVEEKGNFVWLATNSELNRLKLYIFAITETAEEVTKMGWNPVEKFYAFGNGVFKEGKWYQVDDMGIVHLAEKNFYLPAFSRVYAHDFEAFNFERQFVHRGSGNISLRAFLQRFISVYGPNAMVGFAFLVATLFLDIVKAKTKRFPMLNVFGEPGSGKTEFCNVLMSFFIRDPDPPSLLVATKASLNDDLSASINALYHIDEYLNDIDNRIIQFLKNIFGGTGQKKKDMERDKKSKTTKVNCGVVMSGQDRPTADVALFTRVVYLEFVTSVFSDEQRQRYDEFLPIVRMGLSHLTLELLNLRDVFENDFGAMYTSVKKEFARAFNDENVHERVFNNWLVPLAAIRTIETQVDLPFSYKDIFNVAVDGVRHQMSFIRKTSEVGQFWQMLNNLRMAGRIIPGAHYKLEYMYSFKGLDGERVNFPEAVPVLILNYGPAASVVFNRALSGGRPFSGDVNSLETFLRNHGAYMGRNQRRFVVLTQQGDRSFSNGKVNVTRPTAMCFNYNILKETYNINLETMEVDEADIDNDNF